MSTTVDPLEGMTQARWNQLTDRERAAIRNLAGLSPKLTGYEGWRVEVETLCGERRRFIVGRSTGWRPCHLEIKTIRSRGGISADWDYKWVRYIRKVR